MADALGLRGEAFRASIVIVFQLRKAGSLWPLGDTQERLSHKTKDKTLNATYRSEGH